MSKLITILGPTACGKTAVATQLALMLDAEIISADSRQVYRGMTIGTGKDLEDYEVDEKHIPYHLIDIVDAGYKYNLYEYQRDFMRTYQEINGRGKQAILCGGSGLYIESVLKGYALECVPENMDLRLELSTKTLEELKEILSSYKKLHNSTDVDTQKRAIRAIEIEEYYKKNDVEKLTGKPIDSLIFGLDISRELRRERISKRLEVRLKNGLVEEVRDLLNSGLTAEDLIYYGLEYKYVTKYCVGELSFEEMKMQLEIAIHQFAKRQMTWFRGMEKRGLKICWVNAHCSAEETANEIALFVKR